MNLMLRLWSDEAGFVVSSELILVAAIVVMGMLTGMATIRDQVVQELGDVGDSVSELSQTFRWQGTTGHTSSVAGTIFLDTNDFCEAAAGADQATTGPQCIILTVAADGNGG